MSDEIVSLKQYLDQRLADLTTCIEMRIKGLEKHAAELNAARDLALKLADAELERRLKDLNHAHQRAADVLASYLGREVWDKFREEDAAWKRQDEVLRSSWVTQAEFRTYKETTQQALTLATGRTAGIGSVWSTIVVVLSSLAAVGTILTAAGVFVKVSH